MVLQLAVAKIGMVMQRTNSWMKASALSDVANSSGVMETYRSKLIVATYVLVH